MQSRDLIKKVFYKLYYILFMCKRVLNKRTNLGNKYLVNIYIIIVNKAKLNKTWFTKKKGISCGIFY